MAGRRPRPSPAPAPHDFGSGVLRAARPGQTPDRSPKMVDGQYRVTGPRAVYGIEPGAVGRLELTEGQAASLIESGHIAPHVERATPESEKKEEV